MSIVTAAAAITLVCVIAGAVYADDTDYRFQTPSGSIVCDLHSTHTGGAFVYCVAHDRT